MNLSITEKELNILFWIVPEYKTLHEDSWKQGIMPEEKSVVENLVRKLAKLRNNLELRNGKL